MNTWNDLELVGVEFENDGKKAILTFLNQEEGTVLDVSFNKQSYSDGNFIDDPEKAKKVEEWSQDFFGFDFKDLEKAVGQRKTVYEYGKFNSLWESTQVEKYPQDMVGMIMEVVVSDCFMDDTAIRIRWEDGGSTYEAKLGFAKYMEDQRKWFINPQRRTKQTEKFKTLFGIPVERCKELVGVSIMIELKLAFKKFVYAEPKALAKDKKLS